MTESNFSATHISATMNDSGAMAEMPVVPDLRLMVTGGVKLAADNLFQWFDAGAFSVVLGSQLFSDDLINSKQWPALEARLHEAVGMCKSYKTARRM